MLDMLMFGRRIRRRTGDQHAPVADLRPDTGGAEQRDLLGTTAPQPVEVQQRAAPAAPKKPQRFGRPRPRA